MGVPAVLAADSKEAAQGGGGLCGGGRQVQFAASAALCPSRSAHSHEAPHPRKQRPRPRRPVLSRRTSVPVLILASTPWSGPHCWPISQTGNLKPKGLNDLAKITQRPGLSSPGRDCGAWQGTCTPGTQREMPGGLVLTTASRPCD